MAALRQVLLQDKGLPKEAARIAAYWKQGASDFHERLEG
jgi:NADPH-dependent ferric siderophore reductase